MAVSNSELRVLLNIQARGQEVAAQVAQQVEKVTAAMDGLSKSRGAQAAAQQMQQLGSVAVSAAGQVGQLTAQMAKVATSGTNVGQMTSNMAQGFQRVAQSAQQAVQQIQQAAQQARAAGQANFMTPGQSNGQALQAGINAALSAISASFKTAQQQAQAASQSITQSLMSIGNAARGVAGGVAGGLSAAFNGMRSLVGGVTSMAGSIANLGKSAQTLDAGTKSVTGFGQSIQNMVAFGASVAGFNTLLTTLQRAFSTFTDAAIGFNSQLENARIAFTGLLQDGNKAQAFILQLQDFAARTAFDFPGLLHLSQMLVGVGFAAEEVIPMLRQVAGAMTAAGRTSADMQGVGLALQQVFTAGKVNAQDMNQLIQRGIPAWRIMAEAIQQTGEPIEAAIARVKKLSEQGKLTSADFFAAFQEFGKKHNFAEIAENAVASFSGALSNLGDGFRNLVASAAEPAFNRISAGIQGLSNLLTSDPAKQFAMDMKATMEAAIQSLSPLKQAFADAFTGFQTNGISGALSSIVDSFAALATDMGDAGSQLMVEYARGIIQGASDAIQGAVDFVANLIAEFLIGNSPPPSGPLAQIDQGGRNVALAWVQGFAGGFAGVQQVAVSVADAFGNISKQLTLGDVETAFQGAKGNLTGLKEAAEQAEGGLRTLSAAQREIDREQSSISTNVDSIKSSYGEQESALRRSIDAIKEQNTEAEKTAELILKQNDAISKQADLRDKAALNEITAARINAEGDPVKRAELVANQAALKAREQDLGLAQKEHDLAQRQAALDKQRAEGKTKSSTTDKQDLDLAQARINLDRDQLANERALAALVDRTAIARLDAQENEIKRTAALRHAEEQRARLAPEAIKAAAEAERIQKEILALPLEEQLEAVQKAREEALRPLEQQLEAIKAEERALQAVRKEWQGIKADISDAVQAQTATENAAKKAKAGAGGGSALFPNGRPALDRQDIDTSVLDRVGNNLATGIGESFQRNLGPIIFGALGAVLGGSMFGPLGLAAGAYFGTQVGAGVQQRVPDLITIIQDMGRTFTQAFAGDWSPSETLAPAINAVGLLGMAFRLTADIVAGAWNLMKGPIQAIGTFIQENSGLAAAALAGLLVPAFSLLLSTVGAVVGPIIGLLAPLTPAILAVSAAAVALKLAWDTNFGGLQQTVGAAIPLIITAFEKLSEAFAKLQTGDYAGAAESVMSAFSDIGSALAPILQGVGKAILDAAKEWGSYLWDWIVDSTPKAIQMLGTFVDQVAAFVAQNAEPFVRAVAGWAGAFLDWVVPIIGPMIQALGPLSLQVLSWIAQQIPVFTQALTKWSVIFLGWIVTDVIPQIPGMLVMLGQAILAGLAAIIPILLQFGVDMTNAMRTGLIDGLTAISPGLAEWVLSIGALLQAGWDAIVAAVMVVVELIGAAWTGLPGALQAIWDAITGAFDAFVALLQSAWEAFWSAMQTAWEAPGKAIQAGVELLWNSLTTETQASLTQMVATASQLWESLKTLISTVLAAIMTVVLAWIASQTTAWTTLSTTLQGIWTTLTGYATTAWKAITDAITAVVTAWVAVMTTQWNAIILVITGIWDKLATTIGPIVQKAMDVISTVFTTWWEQQKATATKWGELGTMIATTLMEALRLGISEKIKLVSETLTGAMQTLMGIIDRVLGRTDSKVSEITGSIDPKEIAQQKFSINPSAGRSEVLKQWAPVLQALEQSGGPLAKNIAAILLAENGAGNSDLVRNSKNWFSISAVASRRGRGLQSGVDPGGRFASYDTDAQALADFVDLIMNNPEQYGDAWNNRQGSTPSFIQGLVKGRYIVPEPGYPVETWLQNTSKGAQEYENTVGPTIPRSMAPMSSTGPGAKGIMGSEFQRTQQEWAKNAADANAICGPHLAALFADAVGRPPTPEEARNIATGSGMYDPRIGITSAAGYAGYATSVIQAANPGTGMRVVGSPIGGTSIAQATQIGSQSLMGGSPLVGFNTSGHYYGATQFDPENGKFNVGGTGRSVIGGKEWMTVQEMTELTGRLNQVLTLTGQMGDAFTQAGETSTEAIKNVETPVTETEQATKTLAETLLGQVVPAGTESGTAIQKMSTAINPLLGEIATGSLTTEELTGKLLEMAAGFGMTNVPIEAFQQGQITAGEAMQTLIASAAEVDPAFAALQEQLTTTGAGAQEMAVTFAEGIGNATGNVSPALEQMSGAMAPLLEQFTTGQINTDQMSAALVEMAAATGATTRPFRMLQDGATTSNQALAQVIQQAAQVGPEFAALAEEVNTSGEVTATTATKFAELVANFKPAVQQADAVATATTDTATSMTEAAPAAEVLSTALTTSSAEGSTAMQTLQTNVTTALDGTLTTIQGMAEPATEAGRAVGVGIVTGIIEGIDSMMGDLDDKLSELKDKLEEIEEAAKKAKEAAKKKDDNKGGGDEGGGEGDGGGSADRAIAAAESMSTQVIAAMRDAAGAHSPSQASRQLGWDMVAGLEQGQIEDSKYAGMAGDQVVVETLKSMRMAADAHSPSNESKALGRDLVEGLSVGQQQDMALSADAGSMAVEETLEAMRVTADAHSPSNETFRLGKDIIDGLRKALENGDLGSMARDLIESFLREFDSFGGEIYDQVNRAIAVVQQQVAEEENRLLPIQMQIEEQQKKITEAHEGTFASQREQNELARQQIEAEGALLGMAEDRMTAERELSDLQAQQESVRSGSLEVRKQEARVGVEMAGLTAEIAKRERDMLGSRREARNLEQAIAAAQHDLVPSKRQVRDIQMDIDEIMRGTLAQQVAAQHAETETAKGKLRTLEIEDDLANASERGLDQDRINGLFDERSGITKQAENTDRQAQMEQLRRQITAAPMEEQLLGAQDTVRRGERALIPAQDLADDKNFAISQTERFDIQPLQDELDMRQANLDVAQKQRDFMASTLDEAIIGAEQQVALYDAMEQSYRDRIALINIAQQQEENYRDSVANGLEEQLIGMNQSYKFQSIRLGQLTKELQILEAGQKVREASLATMGELQKQLENLGYSFEPAKPPEPAPEPKDNGDDDDDDKKGRGGKKKEKKKKKKKSSSSSDSFEDMGGAVGGIMDGASPYQDIVSAASKATVAIGRVNNAIGKQTTLSAGLATRAVDDVTGALTNVEQSDPSVRIDESYIDSTYSRLGEVGDSLTSTFDPVYGVAMDRTQLDQAYSVTGTTNVGLDTLTNLRTLTIGREELDEAFLNATNTNLQLDDFATARAISVDDTSVEGSVASTGTTLTNLKTLKDGPAGTGIWNATFGVDTAHAFNVGSISTAGATTLTGATLEDVEDITAAGTINSAGFNMNAGAFFANTITASGSIIANGDGIRTTKNIEADDDIKAERIVTGSGRAAGGPVRGSHPYLVGEAGAEIFLPGMDGYILNNATTGRLLDIMGARTEGVLFQQEVGQELAMRGGLSDGGHQSFSDPSFLGGASGPQVVVYKTNEYNLTINTTASSESMPHDFAMMRAMNGDG